MGYVAVRGGVEAIANAAHLVEFYRLRDNTPPIEIKQLKAQFRLAIDKIMGEGGLYAPEYGAIALKQNEGDVFEAAFVMRAYRATLSRKFYSETIDTENMFVKRRISASFKDIPGGQILGATRDYSQRMLNIELAEENETVVREFLEKFNIDIDLKEIKKYGRITGILRHLGFLKPFAKEEDTSLVDVTRDAVKFPAPRSGRLQMLARAETGGIMAIGYSSIRGLGGVHPTIGELRVGLVKIYVKDRTGRKRYLGKVEVTEAETINNELEVGQNGKNVPYMSIGYGLCFGHNETKAISMGILDRAMRDPEGRGVAHDQEYVLYHTDGVESMGFVNHLKLPHYAGFSAGLSTMRKAVKRKEEEDQKLNPSLAEV